MPNRDPFDDSLGGAPKREAGATLSFFAFDSTWTPPKDPPEAALKIGTPLVVFAVEAESLLASVYPANEPPEVAWKILFPDPNKFLLESVLAGAAGAKEKEGFLLASMPAAAIDKLAES